MKMFLILLLTMMHFTHPVKVVSQEASQTNAVADSSDAIRKDVLSLLPEGTEIHKRTGDKIYCFLPHNTEIQGLLCRGDAHRGWETVLYTNGQPALVWLARTEEIQGVPCQAASFWTEVLGGGAAVTFHENGQLAECTLARTSTIHGQVFRKGDHVRFDREGGLIRGK